MKNRLSVPEMREHVMRLLNEHEITFSWCGRPTESQAYRQVGEVRIAPIRSVISYAVALHEIGHIRGKFQYSRSSMVRERWAWRWAKQNALVWASRMENYRCASLAWYMARLK